MTIEALLARRVAAVDDRTLRGRAACRALSEATDAWLAEIFRDAVGGEPDGLALVATGGYGRAELAPGSDLDVWLLHRRQTSVAAIRGIRAIAGPPRGGATPEGAAVPRSTGVPGGAGTGGIGDIAQQVWYPIWDSGLKLGHGVFTVKEALGLASGDLDTATALLSVRTIAGDPDLGRELAERAGALWERRAAAWLTELGRRVAARQAAAGDVAFLLEPNVKEGRGGLRDVHALAWAERARPVLAAGDGPALTEAEDMLLDIRVGLHRAIRKPDDVLLLERQDDVAKLLDLGDADALMAEVAAAARSVAWVSDETWYRIRSTAERRRRILRRDTPLATGIHLHDGAVHLDADVEIAGDPTLVLRTAVAAARATAPIDRASLDRLAERAPLLDTLWPPGVLDALVELLGTGRPAIPVIEALDQRRLVERILPEWAPTRSCPQRNALHRFTVDRHLCEAAANAATLVGRVSRPDLLLIGAWLHDIGKGRQGDHTAIGITLMADIAERMGFCAADVDVLVALVRHHLFLIEVATRRDLSDPSVARAVAETIGSLDVLELVAALTEADSLATGPSAWGPWKAELMGELVDRTAAVLRGADPADAVQRAGFPDAGIRALMAGGRVVVRIDPPLVVVVCPDRAGSLSRVSGALALNSLTVLAAEAASGDGGMAASRFRVEPAESSEPVEVDWHRVERDITSALSGHLAIAARLAQRPGPSRRAVRRQVLLDQPSVRVDNVASATSTVVEVRAPDRMGALYRITRALADLDLDIRSAKVATLGDEVVDTFYVCDAGGRKVLDRDHLRELERAILHQIGA